MKSRSRLVVKQKNIDCWSRMNSRDLQTHLSTVKMSLMQAGWMDGGGGGVCRVSGCMQRADCNPPCSQITVVLMLTV